MSATLICCQQVVATSETRGQSLQYRFHPSASWPALFLQHDNNNNNNNDAGNILQNSQNFVETIKIVSTKKKKKEII